MKRFYRLALVARAAAVGLSASAGKYKFETVPGDPLKTQIYTLPNGLNIFMSVNKDEPRIQANIAVRHFPLTADALRRRLKLKDGGSLYVFATTIGKDHRLILTEKLVAP